MPLAAEEFISEILSVDVSSSILEHAYDPAKAREYYLRTRELKGRQAAKVDPKVHQVTVPKQTAAQRAAAKKAEHDRQKKAAEAKVEKLKARLAKLNKILAELVKQAKARSGVKTPPKTQPHSGSTPSSSKAKPLTAAEKREKAKKAKEARDKVANQSLSDEAKALDEKIKNVTKRIANMKKQIAEAKRKSKKKPRSQTAPKGR